MSPDETAPSESSIIAAAVLREIEALTGHARDGVARSSALVADLGIDSFLLVELLAGVERTLQKPVAKGSEAKVASARNVGQLIDALTAAMERP